MASHIGIKCFFTLQEEKRQVPISNFTLALHESFIVARMFLGASIKNGTGNSGFELNNPNRHAP